MNGLAICAGAGGLELGIGLAIGEPYRSVCYVEREAFAAALLVARMEDKTLEPAPIFDDLLAFDTNPWRGKVDLISAGFPCQPWSVAGQRKGTDDERWLWPAIAGIIREVGPGLVFLENVPGLLMGGAGLVLGDLAALGFDAEWGVFSAAGVGAPHKRERLFILAFSRGFGRGRRDHGDLRRGEWALQTEGPGFDLAYTESLRPESGGEQSTDWARDGIGKGGEILGNSKGIGGGPRGLSLGTKSQNAFAGKPCLELVHADRKGLQESERDSRREGPAEDRARMDPGPRRPGCTFPPGPGDQAGWGEWDGPQPAIRRGSDGLAFRVDRIRVLGNGVVPLVAAHAFRTLAARAGIMIDPSLPPAQREGE